MQKNNSNYYNQGQKFQTLYQFFALQYYYFISMAETPYELLMKKQKERKNLLINSIEKKDLKNRSISYNLKVSSDMSDDPQKKHKEKDKHTRINFANSLKKSFYYRKFLNRTAEGQLTSQQFYKFKDKISKASCLHNSAQKPQNLFRQIWQNQIQRKYSLKIGEEQKCLQITIKQRDDEKPKTLTLEITNDLRRKKDQKKKIEDISEIVEERKSKLDFDLEIQGNKKSIRIKEYSGVSSPSKHKQKEKEGTRTIQTNNESDFINNALRTGSLQKNEMLSENLKPPCTFFKRIQENVLSTEENQNVGFKISRLNYGTSNVYKINSEYRSKYNANNFNTCTTPNNQYCQQRNIRSSWYSSTDQQPSRYYKVETAQKRRNTIHKIRKPPIVSFTNDINGWNIRADNQEQLTSVFGQ